MSKKRTQKYIEKFCEYIDRLISIWNGKKKLDFNKINRIVYKADFIASVLDIKGKGYSSLNHYDWWNLERLRKREKENFNQITPIKDR